MSDIDDLAELAFVFSALRAPILRGAIQAMHCPRAAEAWMQAAASACRPCSWRRQSVCRSCHRTPASHLSCWPMQKRWRRRPACRKEQASKKETSTIFRSMMIRSTGS